MQRMLHLLLLLEVQDAAGFGSAANLNNPSYTIANPLPNPPNGNFFKGVYSTAYPGEHTADLPETPWVAPADDVDSETNGPNAKGCGEGRAVDTTKYDSKFICDCEGTAGTGDNCENLGISDAGSPAAAVVPACMAVAASLAAAFVAV